MRGFVPTPDAIVDLMVAKLFAARPPSVNDSLLDPGCGPGAFIAGVIRWAERNQGVLPNIVGYESEPGRYQEAIRRFRGLPNVKVVCADFLTAKDESFDYIIGNPPYVPITELSDSEKAKFRRRFASAEGRFDLYLLFFEQALRLLNAGGRLVFVTPEKFLYVNTAKSFRRILANYGIHEVHLLNEETFGDLVTYPTVTTVDSTVRKSEKTRLVLRDGSSRQVLFPRDGESLQPLFHEFQPRRSGSTLQDVCVRISCGVATGADSVFVRRTESLDRELSRYAYPTLSGRDLVPGREEFVSVRSMLIPYDKQGNLRPLNDLGKLKSYLSDAKIRKRLEERTCTVRKPWHAFHDSVPLPDMLQPKLLCKDITAEPHFWVDREGAIVPRHTVYYIVPKDRANLDRLCRYLNSAEAKDWLRAHCQRAANGFVRLQSSVLKQLPVPPSLAAEESHQAGARAA